MMRVIVTHGQWFIGRDDDLAVFDHGAFFGGVRPEWPIAAG